MIDYKGINIKEIENTYKEFKREITERIKKINNIVCKCLY